MTKELKRYENKSPIAIQTICNTCSMCILDINDEYVIVKGYIGDLHKYKLNYNSKGYYFTYRNGCRYFINDFIRI